MPFDVQTKKDSELNQQTYKSMSHFFPAFVKCLQKKSASNETNKKIENIGLKYDDKNIFSNER